VTLLKKIHGTLVPEGKLPEMRDTALEWARSLLDRLPQAAGKKLLALTEALPHDCHMLHGDYHTKNLELQNDEVLLIDMDTLAVGHPILELAGIYNAFAGYYELDHEAVKGFQGFDYELSLRFWQKSLAAYLGTGCPAKLREVEDKARILGYARLLRRAFRRGDQDGERGRREIAHWTDQLLDLLETADTLVFSPDDLEIAASQENLSQVQAFVRDKLGSAACSANARLQISVAVEEVFVNIARYAGMGGKSSTVLRVEVSGEPVAVTITFVDHGVPYDPLAAAGADAAMSADEVENEAMGILMAKKLVDDIAYEYREGRNILTLKKKL
jgi:anti-sigma regulatory factor (Ser/Thr protein kinase)